MASQGSLGYRYHLLCFPSSRRRAIYIYTINPHYFFSVSRCLDVALQDEDLNRLHPGRRLLSRRRPIRRPRSGAHLVIRL